MPDAPLILLGLVILAALAFDFINGHGSNDARKSMGVISLALVSYGAMPVFHIPVWVIASCAAGYFAFRVPSPLLVKL